MSVILASRNPSRSKISFAALTSRARVLAPRRVCARSWLGHVLVDNVRHFAQAPRFAPGSYGTVRRTRGSVMQPARIRYVVVVGQASQWIIVLSGPANSGRTAPVAQRFLDEGREQFRRRQRVVVEVDHGGVLRVALRRGVQLPRVRRAVHPGACDTGRREHGRVMVGVQPLQPRSNVVPHGLFDDHDDASVGPERHDFRRDQRLRGRVPVQQRRHAQLQVRSHFGEPPHLGEARPELHEVVVRLLHRVTDEVVDDVADVFEVPGRDDAPVGVVAVRDVAQRVLDAGQLVLLDHVVEQVPPQIAAIVIRRCRRRETEERRLDSDHDAVPPKFVSSNACEPCGASLGKFTPSELVLK